MATILDNTQLANYGTRRYKQYTSEAALLRKLEEAGRVMYGVKGTELKDTMYTAADSQFRTIGIGAVLPRNEQLNEAVATYSWAAYHAHRPFDGLVRKRMGGKFQIINAVTSLIEKLQYDAEEKFSDQLINGDGNAMGGGTGKSMVGLASILTSSDITYAGIAQASNTWWRPQRIDANTSFTNWETDCITILLKAKMDTRRANPNGIKRDADWAIMDRTRLYQLFKKAESRNTVITKKVGEEYEFWGFTLLMDDFMPATAVFVINPDTFELVSTESQLFNLTETPAKDAVPGTVVYDMFMQVCLKCTSLRHNAIVYDLT